MPPTTTRSHANESIYFDSRRVYLLGHRDTLLADGILVMLVRDDFGRDGENQITTIFMSKKATNSNLDVTVSDIMPW